MKASQKRRYCNGGMWYGGDVEMAVSAEDKTQCLKRSENSKKDRAVRPVRAARSLDFGGSSGRGDGCWIIEDYLVSLIEFPWH